MSKRWSATHAAMVCIKATSTYFPLPLCCMRIIVSRAHALMYSLLVPACSTKSSSYICFDGVNRLKGTNDACCGTIAYTSSDSICCAGTIIPEGSIFGCCSNRLYWNTYYICGGDIFYKPVVACCSGVIPYGRILNICCDGHVLVRGSNDDCCGAMTYTISSAICCSGLVQVRGTTTLVVMP